MSNYPTSVFAMPAYVRDDQSLPRSCVIMSCTVESSYVTQSEVGGRSGFPRRILTDAFFYRAEYPSGPFASHHSSPSSQAWAIVSSMLDDMPLLFPLDRLRWLDVNTGMRVIEKRLTRDELVSEIARATSRMVNDPSNEGRKRTKMVVSIAHKVTASEYEMCEMLARQRRLQLRNPHSRILQELQLLSGQRSAINLMMQQGLVTSPDHGLEDALWRSVMRESMDQETINFDAADESMIESLNKVVFEGDQGSSSHELDCVICMEEVAIGDELVRIDCSHEFHKDCIEAWLRIHHTCPLCRYKLPIMKS